jgi:hypothetical protein
MKENMYLLILFIFIGIGIGIFSINYYIVESGPHNRSGRGGFFRIGENRFNNRGVEISTNLYNQNSYCWNNPQSTLCR